MAEPPTYPTTGAPRWVKVLGLVLLVCAALFVILHLLGGGGDHGPGRHGFDGQTPSSSASEAMPPA